MRGDRHSRNRRPDADPRRRPHRGLRLSRPRFARVVRDALDDLPSGLAGYVHRTTVIIDDIPPRASDEVVLAERGATDGECVVRLYRWPIERRSDDREELTEIIQGLVVAQIADHFGLDDATLDDLGW